MGWVLVGCVVDQCVGRGGFTKNLKIMYVFFEGDGKIQKINLLATNFYREFYVGMERINKGE